MPGDRFERLHSQSQQSRQATLHETVSNTALCDKPILLSSQLGIEHTWVAAGLCTQGLAEGPMIQQEIHTNLQQNCSAMP